VFYATVKQQRKISELKFQKPSLESVHESLVKCYCFFRFFSSRISKLGAASEARSQLVAGVMYAVRRVCEVSIIRPTATSPHRAAPRRAVPHVIPQLPDPTCTCLTISKSHLSLSLSLSLLRIPVSLPLSVSATASSSDVVSVLQRSQLS